MSDVTVGLYTRDSRMYYIDEFIAILDNPFNGAPTLVVRHQCPLIEMKMKQAMKEVGMEPVGEQYTRPDGLICQELKEVGDGKR